MDTGLIIWGKTVSKQSHSNITAGIVLTGIDKNAHVKKTRQMENKNSLNIIRSQNKSIPHA